MEEQEIFDSLKEILHTIKPALDQSGITTESELVSDMGIDSLSMLLLSIAIETKFGFKFEGVPPFRTVGDVIGYISEKTA